MKERLNFCVYDFETGSTYSDEEKMTPLEIAAVILDGRTLEVIDGGTFQSFMRPRHVIDFVAYDDPLIQDGALAKNGIRREDIGGFPEEKMVWNNFVDFCLKYKSGASEWGRIVPVGFNNHGFDDIIARNLCERYSTKKCFHKTLSIDLMRDLFQWTEGITGKDAPEKLSFDYFREYLELPPLEEGNAHEALYDVIQTSMVFRRFQEWRRRLIKKNPLKGSFAPKKESV
jgi:exonuclease I